MFQLHVVPAHGDPFDRLLEGDSLVIGRSSESDLMIADRFLSRQHARLYREGDDWLAEDLGSRNGTLLNGKPIEEPTKVRIGDDLQLCGSVVSVRAASVLPSSHREPSSTDFGQHTVFRRAAELIDSQSDSAGDTDAPDALRRFADRRTPAGRGSESPIPPVHPGRRGGARGSRAAAPPRLPGRFERRGCGHRQTPRRPVSSS